MKRALRLSFLTPSLVPSPNSPPKVRGPRALCVASLRRGGRILLLGHSRLRLWVVWDSGMSVPGPRARSKRALRLSFLGTKRRGGRTIWDTRGARRAARGILWLVLVGRPLICRADAARSRLAAHGKQLVHTADSLGPPAARRAALGSRLLCNLASRLCAHSCSQPLPSHRDASGGRR